MHVCMHVCMHVYMHVACVYTFAFESIAHTAFMYRWPVRVPGVREVPRTACGGVTRRQHQATPPDWEGPPRTIHCLSSQHCVCFPWPSGESAMDTYEKRKSLSSLAVINRLGNVSVIFS